MCVCGSKHQKGTPKKKHKNIIINWGKKTNRRTTEEEHGKKNEKVPVIPYDDGAIRRRHVIGGLPRSGVEGNSSKFGRVISFKLRRCVVAGSEKLIVAFWHLSFVGPVSFERLFV